MNAQKSTLRKLATFMIDALGWNVWRTSQVERIQNHRREIQTTRDRIIESEKQRQIEWCNELPVYRMTEEQFVELPCEAQINLDSCDLGTWFVITSPEYFTETVLGNLVSSDSLLSCQWGSRALSLPYRGVNKYRLHVIKHSEFIENITLPA